MIPTETEDVMCCAFETLSTIMKTISGSTQLETSQRGSRILVRGDTDTKIRRPQGPTQCC